MVRVSLVTTCCFNFLTHGFWFSNRKIPNQNRAQSIAFLPWFEKSTLVLPSWLWKCMCFPHEKKACHDSALVACSKFLVAFWNHLNNVFKVFFFFGFWDEIRDCEKSLTHVKSWCQKMLQGKAIQNFPEKQTFFISEFNNKLLGWIYKRILKLTRFYCCCQLLLIIEERIWHKEF